MAIQIQIGADVDDAVSGITLVKNVLADLAAKGGVSIGALELSLKDFQVRLKAATDPKDIARLTQGITGLSNKIKELKGLGAGSFDQLARSSNSANLALINTGRVIQDLPFGFLGIANNLNPLLESFQRLKAESGSSATALGTMVKSLSGPQGLGLALSIVSSLLISFGSSLFGTKKAAEDNAIALGLFNNSVKSLEDNVDDLVQSLNILNQVGNIRIDIAFGKSISSEILKQQEQSVQRQIALSEANDTLTESFKKARQSSTKFFDEVSRSTLTAFNQFGTFKSVPDEVAEKFNSADKKLFESAKQAQESVKNIQSAIKKLRDEQKVAFPSIEQLKIEKLKQDADDAKKIQDDLLSKNKAFVSATIAEGKKLAEAFEGRRVVPFFGNLDTLGEQFEKARKLIQDFNAGDLKIIFRPLVEIEPKFAFETGFVEKQLKEQKEKLLPRFRNFLEEFKTDFEKIKVNLVPTIQISPELRKVGIDANILKSLSDKLIALGGTIPTIDVTLPVNVKTDILNASIAQQELTNNLNNIISTALEGIATEGFAGIGEAIGAALSGGDLGSVFKQFGVALAGAVQALGKQLIQLGVQALLIRKAVQNALLTPAGPAILIAAGIGLVALGAALKNALGKGLQGFAKGGRPPVGVDVLVGEKGPEIVRLDRPGTVITASETKKILNTAQNPMGLQPAQIKELVTEVSRVVTSQIERLTTVFNERLLTKETKDRESSKDTAITSVITKLHDSITSNKVTGNKESFTNVISKLVQFTHDRESFSAAVTKIHDTVFSRETKNNFHEKQTIEGEKSKSHSDSLREVLSYVSHDKLTINKETIRLLDNLIKKDSVSKLTHNTSVTHNESLQTIVSRLHEIVTNNNSASQINRLISDRVNISKETSGIEASASVTHSTLQQLSSTINKLHSTINNLGDTISNIHNITSIGDQIKTITHKITQSFINTFTTLVPARATGGRVDAHKPHLVGEHGPEIFIPKVHGIIIPNNKLKQVFSQVTNFSNESFSNIATSHHRQFGGSVIPGQQFLTGEAGAEAFFQTSGRLTPVTNTQGISGSGAQLIEVVVSGLVQGDNLRLIHDRTERKQRRTT